MAQDRKRPRRPETAAAASETSAEAPSPRFDPGAGTLAMSCASVALALFAFGYVLRGGMVWFGFVNLTFAFLLAAVGCVAVHFLMAKEIRFQLTWADLAMVGLTATLFANSNSVAGFEKSMRFAVLVLTPYFLARVILVDFTQVRRFLYTVLAVVTIIGVGVFAFSVLPEEIGKNLPFEKTEWGKQRLNFLEANAVQLGLFFLVGIMVYSGLVSQWKGVWMLAGLTMMAILFYVILPVGTRGTLLAAFGTFFVAVLFSLVMRRYTTLLPLSAGLVVTSFFLYTIFSDRANDVLSETGEPSETEAMAETESSPEIETKSPTETIIVVPTVTLPNQERFETMKASSLDEFFSNKSNKGRVELYSEAVSKFKENPVFGAGSAGMKRYAHNIFLETAAELGLVGLFFLFVIFGFTIKSFHDFFKKTSEKKPYHSIGMAVLLVVIALFFQKQLSTGLTHHKDLIIFSAIALNFSFFLHMPDQESKNHLLWKYLPEFQFGPRRKRTSSV